LPARRRSGKVDAVSAGHLRNLRWYIAALLCCSTALNYLDRQTLSILASTIQRDLRFSTVEYSYVSSAFLLSYTVMYLVGGRLVDLLGTRRALILFVSGWSVADMLNALAHSWRQLAVFRFLLGVTEAANIPAGVKAVAEWFPMRERALAVGIFNSGTALGAALAVPVVSSLTLAFGWRFAFVITGALGFVWVAGWALSYRVPAEHPRLSPEERELILAAPPNEIAAPAAATAKVSMRRLLSLRATWGCIAARALTDPISYLFTFWIPKYLQDERGFKLADLRNAGWIPFVALALGNIAAGVFPRALVARGWSLDRARKRTMLVTSLAIPLLCLALTRVSRPGLALVALSAWMFAHAAWGNVILPAEVFPPRVVATVTGMGGAVGALVGALSQLAIGRVVQTVSFTPVFAACAGAYALGFALVVWLVPDLGRIREVG
jgi:MFS transporter, ACS family, hexuronate transporter